MVDDKKVFANGLKIDDALDVNLSDCVARVRSKKASLIGIDGGVGEGKTTLAVICAKRLASFFGQEFSIKDQVRQGGSDFLKGMDWCVQNKRSVIVYDEAGDFNTRASLTYFNSNMNRVFETYRALGIIVILCLPSFSDIDTSLMKKKILRFLVHCYGRNSSYGNYKVYALWRLWYVKASMLKCTVPDDAYKFTRPNSVGHFKDLDVVDANALEVHSIAGKKDIIRKGMLQERGMLPIKTIAHRTGYSIDTIRRYIKRVKAKGEKYGATLYYHKEVIEGILTSKEREGRVS